MPEQQEGAPAGAEPVEPSGPGEQGADGAVFTQADVDRIIGERLSRAKAQFADYDELKSKAEQYDELQEAQKTELQREQEARAEAEARAAQVSTELMRRTVAASKGLPPGLAARLTGATEEEMAADADELLKIVAVPEVPNHGRPSPHTPRVPLAAGQQTAATDMNEWMRHR